MRQFSRIQFPIIILLITVGVILGVSSIVSAQESIDNTITLSQNDSIILFGVSTIVVVGIFIYLARDTIFRKKTNYDYADVVSKQNRDQEKYHSDWSEDYKELGENTAKKEKTKKNIQMNINYYDTLGLDRNATQKEIKEKYRKLAKQSHPDKNKDEESEKIMSEINEAYEILSDAKTKKIYDSMNES